MPDETASSSETPEAGSPEEESRTRPVPVECTVCSELADGNVLLEPCKHRIACEDCSARMKKCLQCCTNITKRITQGAITLHICYLILKQSL